jgi:hypothetical protein
MPALDEQARQFSALMSETTPDLSDVGRRALSFPSFGTSAGTPETGAGERTSSEETPEGPKSPQDLTPPQDLAFPRDLMSLKDSTSSTGLPLSKALTFSKDPPLSRDPTSLRFAIDAAAHRNGLLETAIDPDDSPTRRQVAGVAPFLTPHWPVLPAPLVQAPLPSAPPDLTFAELVQQHVRRTLALQAMDGSVEDEVRLELSDAVLPGTTLSLRRTCAGWQLLATTDNRQSRDKLSRFGPALIARFAQASLGSLEIVASDPEVVGDAPGDS